MSRLVATIGGTGAAPNLGQLGDIRTEAEERYATLRQKCIEQYGEGFCNSVLPRNMIYALTRRDEGYTLPWWLWMILGYAAGKVIRL